MIEDYRGPKKRRFEEEQTKIKSDVGKSECEQLNLGQSGSRVV